MEKLKPCPFCGAETITTKDAVIYAQHSRNCYFYFSDNQGDFDFYNSEKDRKALFDAWNRRAAE